MDLYEMAVELGLTPESSSREITKIAIKLVDEHGFPDSAHNAMRVLLRMQRSAQRLGAA